VCLWNRERQGDVTASRGIVAEIGEVVAGSAVGRTSDDEITVFKSVGVAVEDVSAATLVYQLAVDENAQAAVEDRL
jgi:alanine dehydrogenase